MRIRIYTWNMTTWVKVYPNCFNYLVIIMIRYTKQQMTEFGTKTHLHIDNLVESYNDLVIENEWLSDLIWSQNRDIKKLKFKVDELNSQILNLKKSLWCNNN